MADTAVPTAATPKGIQDTYMDLVRKRRMYSGLLLLVFVALMVSGFNLAAARNAGGFWVGLPNFFDFPKDVVLEAWDQRGRLPEFLWEAMPALIETINIAGTATLIGTIGGGLLSLLSTRGLAAFPKLVPVFRRLSDVMRAFPEIVIALVLIFILGGGPVPAMIAIAIHTVGALTKQFSEVTENVSLKPVEGLASVGANWTQQMAFGVLPQVAPNWFSYALMRFEINIRASAILGFVGAGGIGYELRNAITFGQGRFDNAAAIFMLLFATIVVVDQISTRIRMRLTHGAKP